MERLVEWNIKISYSELINKAPNICTKNFNYMHHKKGKICAYLAEICNYACNIRLSCNLNFNYMDIKREKSAHIWLKYAKTRAMFKIYIWLT